MKVSAGAGWTELAELEAGPRSLRRAAEIIKASSPAHTSVFLYALEGDTLVLRAQVGRPTIHERLAVGQGVCGRAVAEQADQIVHDVTADPDYIACSVECRSEIVVLVRRDGRIVGQIDIDSDQPAAFDTGAHGSLEAAAALIAPLF